MVKNSSCCNLLVIFQRTYSGIFNTYIRVVNCLEARGKGVVLFDINCLASASFYSVFCPLCWQYRLHLSLCDLYSYQNRQIHCKMRHRPNN
jgi:hypothetical protein